ncbi:MAG TPA: hypothetical protein DCS67_10270, partial [Clostridiales bacterium UBA8960]|nr:hypothetical protein [Clostridiales bacterium UBA8960]
MKNFKTYVVSILAFTIILSSSLTYGQSFNGYAYKNVAPWYEIGVKEAEAWKVIPERFRKLSMDQPITRGEFAESIVLAYLSLTGKLPEDWDGNRFTDKPNAYANVASTLGLVSGYDDGSFRSSGLIKREEMFAMIYKLIAKLDESGVAEALSTDEVLAYFADAMQISAWAKDATALMVSREIVSGTDKKTLEPKQNTTRAQALVILNNALKTLSDGPVSSRTIDRSYKAFLETAYNKNNAEKNVAEPVASVEVVATKGFNIDSLYANAVEPEASTTPVISRGGRRDFRSLEEIYTPEEMLVMLGN